VRNPQVFRACGIRGPATAKSQAREATEFAADGLSAADCW